MGPATGEWREAPEGQETMDRVVQAALRVIRRAQVSRGLNLTPITGAAAAVAPSTLHRLTLAVLADNAVVVAAARGIPLLLLEEQAVQGV